MRYTLQTANGESSQRESTFSENKWLLQHPHPEVCVENLFPEQYRLTNHCFSVAYSLFNLKFIEVIVFSGNHIF